MKKVIICAHRGLDDSAPENTQAAFEGALVQGMAVEMDIQRTEDDHLDTLGMVCEILPLAVAMYFLNVDEPENVGDNVLYYVISVVALIVAVTPLVVGLRVTVKAHMEERKRKKEAAEPSESFDNAAHEDAEAAEEDAKD